MNISLCITTILALGLSPLPLSAAQAVPQELGPAEIEALVNQVRKAPDVATAQTAATRMLKGGTAARQTLLTLVADPSLTPAARSGVLGSLMTANDRGADVIAAFGNGIAVGDPKVEGSIVAALVSLHSRGSVLDLVMIEARKRQGAVQKKIIHVATGLVANEAERLRVADALIGMLEAGVAPEVESGIEQDLIALTFQPRLHGAQEWRAWYTDFQKRKPGEFSKELLFAEAMARVEDFNRRELAAKNREVVQAHRRGIDLLTADRILPLSYLDPESNPQEGVRAYAAEKLPAAAGSDPARQQVAADALIASLARDPSVEVRRRVLSALERIVSNAPAGTGPKVAAAILEAKLLESPELDLVRLAVGTLRATRERSAAAPVADLYRRLLGAPDRGADRLACISALFALRGGDGTIVDALRDPDPDVRKAAASSLTLIGDPGHAAPLATAILEGHAAQNRQEFVAAINKLGNYAPPEVVRALQAVALEDGPARPQAMVGLVRAITAGATPQADLPHVIETLKTLYPGAIPTIEGRAELIALLDGQKNPALRPLVGVWTLAEPDPELARRLAGLVVACGSPDVTLFRELGRDLLARSRAAAASVLASAALRTAAAADAAPEQRQQVSPLRRLLAATLIEVATEETFGEAEALLNAELQATPDDGSVLRQRGHLRIRRGQRQEGLEDLILGFTQDEATLAPDLRRTAVQAIARECLELKKAKQALHYLAKVPAPERDRLCRHLEARAHLTLEEFSAAHESARLALTLPGEPSDDTLLRLEIEAGLQALDPAIRRSAAQDLQRLADLTAKSGGNGLDHLLSRAAHDRDAQKALQDLAAGTIDLAQAQSALTAVPRLTAALWLVAGLDPTPARHEDVLNRLTLLRALLPDEPALQSLEIPTNGNRPSADTAALAQSLRTWWTRFTTPGS